MCLWSFSSCVCIDVREWDILMCVSDMYECVCAWTCMCKIWMRLRKGKQTHPHANGKLPQWIHKYTAAILELSKQAGRSLDKWSLCSSHFEKRYFVTTLIRKLRARKTRAPFELWNFIEYTTSYCFDWDQVTKSHVSCDTLKHDRRTDTTLDDLGQLPTDTALQLEKRYPPIWNIHSQKWQAANYCVTQKM